MHFTESGNLIEKHTIIFKVTKEKNPCQLNWYKYLPII